MDTKLNNTKGILIFLVVFGHFLELISGSFIYLFYFIYSFHMPLFVFISGYFSKRINIRKIIRITVLLLIFQLLFVLTFKIFGYIRVTKISAMTVPIYHLWYLLSLVFWYMTALVLNHLKNTLIRVLIIASLLIISVFSRYFTDVISSALMVPDANGFTFGFQRTLSFFPYFLLGYLIPKSIMNEIYDLKPNFAKLIFIPFFMIIGYISLHVKNINQLFQGGYGFSEMTTEPYLPSFIQLYIVYLIIPALSLGILNFIPSKKTLFSNLGTRTMSIFILHPFLILIGYHLKQYILNFSLPVQLFILFLFSVASVLLTGNKIVASLFITNQKHLKNDGLLMNREIK